ncbi:MAG: hypothetical protein AB2A00_27275, partial [Myxococcota bacterium]
PARPERTAAEVAATRTVAAQRLGGLDRAALEARLSSRSPLSVQAEALTGLPAMDQDRHTRVSVGPGEVEMRTRDEVQRNALTHHPDGTSTLAVGRSQEASLQASVDVGAVGVSAGVEAGSRAAYELTGPRDTVQAVADGRIPRPDVFSPETIPVGASVRVSAEQNQGSTLGASFRGIGMEFGQGRSEGTAFEVSRLDENTVRVTAGRLAGVQDSTGVSAPGVKVGVERSFETEHSRAVDIDISTPEGRDAYREFTATGRLPEPGTPGVRAAGDTTTVNVDTSIGLSLGPLEITAAERGVQVQGTVRPDGTQERSLSVREGDLTTTARITRAPSEDPVLGTDISMQNVPAATARAFMEAAGLPPRQTPATDGSVALQHPRLDVTIQLNEQRMMALRDQAREVVGRQNGSDPVLQRLAEAQTPADVQQVLAGGLHAPPVRSSTDGLLSVLQRLRAMTGRPVDLGLRFSPSGG